MLEASRQERALQVHFYDASIEELERRIAAQDFADFAASKRAPRTVANLRTQRERWAPRLGGQN